MPHPLHLHLEQCVPLNSAAHHDSHVGSLHLYDVHHSQALHLQSLSHCLPLRDFSHLSAH